MDYLKPELALRAQKVERTIVVFGSARICEPAEARRRVEAARTALADDPENAETARRVAVAERVLVGARPCSIWGRTHPVRRLTDASAAGI